jgi:hypothetical protein
MAVNAADAPRISVFSTSTDWEAVTGLRLSQYEIEFIPDNKLIGNNGLEIYVLDGFPCYGQTERARMWIGPNGRTDGGIRVVCAYAPEKLSFAWRNAARDDAQGRTTGIMDCELIDGMVNMSKCVIGKEWDEFR